MNTAKENLDRVLSKHQRILKNSTRKELIQQTLENKEALTLSCGALATWTPSDATGRCPKDTFTVKREPSAGKLDWSAAANLALDPEVFDELWADALKILEDKKKIYITDRVVGADSSYAMPTRVITDRAISSLFTDNMFRPVPSDIKRSIFADQGFTILALPNNKVDRKKYAGKLRTVNGLAEPRVLVLDYDRRLGLIMGTAYCGTIKKMMFTVMDYFLPEKGLLPLHCSANEGADGSAALFLGLSGTGKTTLSSDKSRALIGDDEHGWSDNGIANFENGCYAKLINLNPEKEPEIYKASFHQADVYDHGTIIENCMVYPDGSWDVNDARLAENSRVSYPLNFLSNTKTTATGGHPKTIVFLTADANGVLPPVAKLTRDQAMLWFVMGYTSKLAGTETGVTEPVSTFSRFFGGPFMPRMPQDYISLFGKRIDQHKAQVYLINTGWSGGGFGVGKRMDINTTRAIVNAALYGKLSSVECEEDSRFHLLIPKSCPDVDSAVLNPRNTWADKAAYDKQAAKLAGEFSAHFDKTFAKSGIDPKVVAQCPGK